MKRMRNSFVWLSAIISIILASLVIYILVAELALQFKILWIAVFGLLATGLFANIQLSQTSNIANRQHYRDTIAFLSSESPAARRKGVEDLYEYAKENNTKAKEVWKILNDHVKYFTRYKSYQESFPNAPASDIELILKIQSSTDYIDKKDYPFKDMRVIDWDSAWLNGVRLGCAQLQGANLNSAKMKGSDLMNTQLQRAKLHRTQLQNANLTATRLQGALMSRVQLQNAILSQPQMHGVDLKDAHLQGAYLSQAQLQMADLSYAHLEGAHLWHTQLQGAILEDANMQGVHLSNTNLQEVIPQARPEMIEAHRKEDKGAWFSAITSSQVDEHTKVDSVVFEGGITPSLLDNIEYLMNLDSEFWEMDDYMKELREKLKKLLKTLKEKHLDTE